VRRGLCEITIRQRILDDCRHTARWSFRTYQGKADRRHQVSGRDDTQFISWNQCSPINALLGLARTAAN